MAAVVDRRRCGDGCDAGAAMTDKEDDGMMTAAQISALIAEYEAILGMTSRELLDLYHRGEAPDTFEAMHLEVLLRYRKDDGLMTDEQFANRVAEYEGALGMTSQEFLELWRAGNAPDTYEAMALSMLLRAGDVIPQEAE